MLTIPESVWNAMLDAFAVAPAGVERVAYLDGVPAPDDEPGGVVTTVVVPRARLEPGRYVVDAEAMSAAGRHLRPNRLRRLAQVHTHGGIWTGHSPTDDGNAYSPHPGAISIVLAHHAADRPAPADGTVHLRRRDEWHPLSLDETKALVRIVPAVIDQSGHQREEAQRWDASATGTRGRLAALWARLTRPGRSM